jgi:hypothetical protein
MLPYDQIALQELHQWQEKMTQEPSLGSQLTKKVQDKLDGLIPEKVHEVITGAIKQMVRGVLSGSEFISGGPLADAPLEVRERHVREKIGTYRKMGAASGAVTGAGGILLGLADFPVLLSLKMKLLFDIGCLYGYPVPILPKGLHLHIFPNWAFCSPERAHPHLRANAPLGGPGPTRGRPTFTLSTGAPSSRNTADYIDQAKLCNSCRAIGAVVGGRRQPPPHGRARRDGHASLRLRRAQARLDSNG